MSAHLCDRDTRTVIRVLVADDHAVFRGGLAALLDEEPDIEVVGLAIDGQEAVELTEKLHPDVVVMDITMPRLNGIEATRRICERLPHARVIGLSMHEEADMAVAMTNAGAVDYVTKTSPADRLLRAIRQAQDPR